MPSDEQKLVEKVRDLLVDGYCQRPSHDVARDAIQATLEDMFQLFKGEPAAIIVKVYARHLGIPLSQEQEQEGESDG